MARRTPRNSRYRTNRHDGVRDFTGFSRLLVGALKQQHVTAEKTSPRFGRDVIRFTDPDGLLLELIASDSLPEIEPWPNSPIPPEHALRGFYSVSAALEGYERTSRLLTDSFGYRLVEESGNRFRFASPDESAPGRIVDLLC